MAGFLTTSAGARSPWPALRSPGNFSQEEVEYVAELITPLAMGLRASLVVDNPQLDDVSFGPGLIVLGEDLQPEAISPAGERWLLELRETESEWMGPLANSVYSVLARLRELESVQAGLPDAMPRLRTRLASGQWLSVQASRLTASNGQQRVAVIIEPATPTEIAPLIVSAYSLTSCAAG